MTSDSTTSSYIRALVELGENIIFKTHGLEDRGGLSGGFLLSGAVKRAKFELIERDAFLFHYRTVTPFLSRASDPQVGALLFEMRSSVPGVHCFFATTPECAEGHHPCLLLGLGAHEEAAQARKKALGELATMKMDHELRPGWCAALEANPDRISRVPDFHHVQSRDGRNIQIIRKLCDLQDAGRGASVDPVHIEGGWNIQTLESPIRFVKYGRIENAKLRSLKFGEPELVTGASDRPLYHPIW